MYVEGPSCSLKLGKGFEEEEGWTRAIHWLHFFERGVRQLQRGGQRGVGRAGPLSCYRDAVGRVAD
jgi:hypothetical protein